MFAIQLLNYIIMKTIIIIILLIGFTFANIGLTSKPKNQIKQFETDYNNDCYILNGQIIYRNNY